MIKSPKRIAVHICNIVISILCILSIAMYFFQPLWKIDVSYTLPGETVEKLFKGMAQSGNGEDINDIDLEMHDIPLHMSLTFETKDVLASMNETPTAAIQKMIDSNVSALIDQLTRELNTFVKEVVKAVSKKTVTSSVKDQVQSILGESATVEEVDQVLQDAGITDTYIEEKTDALIESIYQEDATVDSVTEEVVNVVEETFDMLAGSGNSEFEGALTEETKEEIRNAVSEVLSSIADENGNLNIDELIASGILDILKGSDSSDNNEGGDSSEIPTSNRGFTAGTVTPLSDELDNSIVDSSNDDSKQTEEDLYEELKTQLLEEIYSELPDSLAATMAEAMKYVSYVLIFTFCTWGYLIVKILCKLMKTNNAIKVGVPIWLGCIPFLILYAVPNFVLPPVLNTVAPAEIASALSFSFSSGSWFSFVAAVALALLSIFYYGGLRRYLRKVEKGMIVIDTPVAQETPATTQTTDASVDVDEADEAGETATAQAKTTPAKTEQDNNDVVKDVDE